ncbi:MAG TPA: S1C family serine protease [Burkholderiaceae bacterium]|nr:S1C family serine protease [Burkholderiaceae bacterium]
MTQALDKAGITPLQALSESIAATVEKIASSTVALRGRSRHTLGCGVVWRPAILVTAAHVFGRAPATVSAVTARQAGADLTLVGTDPPTDVAVFRLPDDSLPAVDLSSSAGVRPGQLAILVGRSLGAEVTARVSVINRASGAWQTWLGGQLDRLIRLDAGLHDGLSGAPVADAAGQVFGMATSALSRSVGVVVPESTICRIVDELLAKGHVARAFLGIGVQPVSVTDAPSGSADASGLLITSLLPGGPATQAGLLVGDIVLGVAQHRAGSVPELRDALAGNIGKSVHVSLIRGGAPAELDVMVGQWPAQARAC